MWPRNYSKTPYWKIKIENRWDFKYANPFNLPTRTVIFNKYVWNIFTTLLYEMGPRAPTKGNAQLNR